MTEKEQQLSNYVGVMLATEIMISNAKLKSMNDIPETLQDELNAAVWAVTKSFINIEDFVNTNEGKEPELAFLKSV